MWTTSNLSIQYRCFCYFFQINFIKNKLSLAYWYTYSNGLLTLGNMYFFVLLMYIFAK